MSYFPSINQNVIVDTANSVSGATIVTYVNPADIWNYNGLGTSTLGVNAIQLVVTSTKNLTIYVDQGNANNSFQITDTYEYLTTRQFGITVQTVGAYVRIRAKNSQSASATATINTALCPIVEAVPRSLDSSGFFQVAIKGIDDGYGFEVENTPTGEMRSTIPQRLVGASFEGSTLDTNFWTATNTNGGTVTTVAGTATIKTNTTANGAALLNSVRRARYVSASSNGYRAVVRLGDTGTANNTRRWGVGMIANYNLTITSAAVVAGDVYTNNSQQFIIMESGTVTTAVVQGTGNPGAGVQTYTKVSGTGPATLTGSTFATGTNLTDGAWFQLSGTSTFSIATCKGGIANISKVDSGSFNGDLGATWTPTTNATTYEIYWTNSKVWFVVGGVLLHTFSATSGTWASTMSLQIIADNINSGGSTTSVDMFIRVASIRRLGPLLTQPTSKYSSGQVAALVLKYGPGNLQGLTVSGVANNGAVITLYDGIAAGGNIIWSGTFQANIQGNYDFHGLPFFNGLTLTQTTQNSNVVVIYE